MLNTIKVIDSKSDNITTAFNKRRDKGVKVIKEGVLCGYCCIRKVCFHAEAFDKLCVARHRSVTGDGLLYICEFLVGILPREKESARSCDLGKRGISRLNVSDSLEVLRYQAADFRFRGS